MEPDSVARKLTSRDARLEQAPLGATASLKHVGEVSLNPVGKAALNPVGEATLNHVGRLPWTMSWRLP